MGENISKQMDLALWESMQESFSESTGLPLFLVDPEGNFILSTGPGHPYREPEERSKQKNFLLSLIERAKTEDGVFRCDGEEFYHVVFPLKIEKKLKAVLISPLGEESEEKMDSTKKMISNFANPVFLLSYHLNLRELYLKKLKVLQSISKMINSTLDLEEILVFIANFMRRAFSAEVCSIIIAEKKDGEFSVGKRVISLDNVDEMIIEADKLACKHFLGVDKINVVEDLQTDSRFQIKGVPNSLLSLSLTAQGKPIGLVNLYGETAQREGEDFEVLTAIIELAATAINNAYNHGLVKKLSITDHLTGLYMRRYFMEVLQNELSRSKRFKEPLSLLMFDVDHFKHYNDTNGHQAGDKLLKELGTLLMEVKRESDLAGRYGGEEFIMIMPRTDAAGAHKFAERLRKIIQEYKFDFEKQQPSGDLTVSMGLITTHYPEIGVDALIGEADKNLYKAKAAGRNKLIATVKVHKDLGNISIT